LAACLLAWGCAQAPVPSTVIEGTATYRERMALPPNAVFEATLENIAKADAKAEVAGRARVEQPGNPPIHFAIPYDASRIDPKGRYAVRARITVDGRLLFITDQYNPMAPKVNLVLRRVGAPVQGGDEPLENTYWKLTHLGDKAVVTPERQREAHFLLHPADRRVSGSGGCNGIAGSYTLDGERLVFGQMQRTMMACPTGMDTENEFLAALGRTRTARVGGRTLELLDAGGKILVRFEALHRR
jgi:putative lipoprotein